MKKILISSGIIAVCLLIFIFTGAADMDDSVKKALRQGNKYYASAGYKSALRVYETGLAANPESKALNFNAAQTAYLLGEYKKAVEYYEKGEDCVEKFLNVGNIFFKAGDAVEDEEQKAQYYMQAMQLYYEGIIKFPQDVPLKYNYEKAKEKVKEFSENQEQENNESGEGEEGEEQENENAEEQENQEGQEQESDENQESEEQEAYNREDDENESDLDREAIERILEMLENQEEESLKNNQEIINKGDNKNGW